MTTSEVQVSYCSLHVGHDMELRHLKLSSDVRLQVEDLLRQGLPISTVMDTMRGQLGPALERDKLLSRSVEWFVSKLEVCTSRCYLLIKLARLDKIVILSGQIVNSRRQPV